MKRLALASRRTGLALAASLLISGCAGVDHFAGRVVTYNDQMQDTRAKLILANILRSGNGEPLQFSDVSTVSGQGSAQGSLGTVLPFFGPKGSAGTRLFQLNPAFQFNGGPTVGVANLNTQEFFNGITTPLTMDQVAAYVSNGQSRLSVLLLTVAAVDYDLGGIHYHFAALADDPDSLNILESVLIALIHQGLAFQSQDTVTYVGPPLTAEDVVGKSVLQNLMRAPVGATVPALKRYSMTDPGDQAARDALSVTELARLKNAGEFYRLTTTATKTKPCFAAPSLDPFGYVMDPNRKIATVSMAIGKYNKVPRMVSIGADYVCSSNDKGDGSGLKNLSFTFRSVRGIFTVLGTMAHKELETSSPAYFDFGPEKGVERLFGVERFGDDPNAPPSAANIRITRGASDLSAVSIQFLSELIAINSDAKSFPAPSIVPFFTP